MAGKAAVAESLGTADVREARVLAGKRRAELLEQWSGGEALPLRKPTLDDLEALAVAAGYDMGVEQGDARRRLAAGVSGEQWARRVRAAGKNLADKRQRAATGDASMVQEIAEIAAAESGLDITPGTVEFDKLCGLLAAAQAAAAETNAARAGGDVEAEAESKLVQRVRDRGALKAAPGETLADLFEVYAAQRIAEKGKRPAGIDQDRMVVEQFAEFVGKGRAVAAIGYAEAKEFVDALGKIPAGYKKRTAYRGLSVREAIKKGQRENAKPLSAVTKQRYISTLSPFFRWLAGERGGRRIAANPFEGLHLDISRIKKQNPRPPFTAAHIQKIIHSPLFTGFAANGREHLPGNMRADDWRHWLPLIALFTGARIGEVAQLHVADIGKVDRIWCVEFRHDEAAGQRTKSGNDRTVALHSTLLKIGLLDFVERQRKRAEKDGNPQLFPDLKPGPRQQYGDEPSKWWRRYLDRIGVKSGDGDGFGSHSFRHTMADQLRAAGHLDAVFGPLILGHAGTGAAVTAGYGQARQGTPAMSRDLIESVRFVPIERGRVVEGGEPVSFEHLYAANTDMH